MPYWKKLDKNFFYVFKQVSIKPIGKEVMTSIFRAAVLGLSIFISANAFASPYASPQEELLGTFMSAVRGANAPDTFALEKAHNLRSETQVFCLTRDAPAWDEETQPSNAQLQTYMAKVPHVMSWLKVNLAQLPEGLPETELGQALFALFVNAHMWPVSLETLEAKPGHVVPQILTLAAKEKCISLVQTLPFIMHQDDLMSHEGALAPDAAPTGRHKISVQDLVDLTPDQRHAFLYHIRYAFPYLNWRDHGTLYTFYTKQNPESLHTLVQSDFALTWSQVMGGRQSAVPSESSAGDELVAKGSLSYDLLTFLAPEPYWVPLPAPKKMTPGVYKGQFFGNSFLPLMEGQSLTMWMVPPQRSVELTESQANLQQHKVHGSKQKCILQ
ncbi:MAG: hypothetical protein C0514_08730 [Candidatus Puniceispirillum sp.]|nr:hypothetical protein [Candidatus Puniceispirillum sp.]